MSVLRADAPFYWPLRGSLALQNGSGSPTFTRATAAWDFNHIGKLVSVPSGAVRMRGYRPVTNRVASSEGAFDSAIRASSSTGNVDVPSGKGCATSTKLVEDSTALASHYGTRTISVPTLGTYKIRQYYKAVGRSSINMYGSGSFPFPAGGAAVIDLVTGTVTGTAAAYVTATLLGNGWVEVISTHSPTATGSHTLYTEMRSAGSSTYSGDGVSGVLCTGVMAVNITPNSLTTVPEYVSIGVLSSPWHGAGVDGVKYFSTYEDGTAIPEANLLGARLNPNAVTNNLLYCRDLTNAAWVKTNVTAALTQTGLDGRSNACSLLTASAANGTVLQTITAASAAACSGFYVKRSVGTGSIYFTRDGGSNWTDITSSINSTDFTLVKIENTSVLNPRVGFKIATSGDAIIVDAGINHLGAQISETPIITTSAAVTVNADVPTAPTSGNFSDTAGTILATVTRDDWTAGNGSAVGSATRGLYTSSTNSGAQGLDGTNTVNGPTGTPGGTVRIGLRWNNSVIQAFTDSGFGTSGSYDGGFDLASIALAAGVQCTIKDVSIWPYSLTNEDITYAIKDPASIKISCRSIAVRRSRNRNLSKYFATNYAGITIGAPTNFYGGWNNVMPADIYVGDGISGGTVPNTRKVVCDIPFTGTDTETGFAPPTGSPMYATVLYGVYAIDWMNGFATNDAAGLSGAGHLITFKDVVIEGRATKALSLKLLAVDSAVFNHSHNTPGYRQQLWGTVHRNVSVASDFQQMGFSCFVWINDLTGKLSVNNRRVTFIDMKNGHATLGGALRRSLTIIMANSADAAEFGVPVGTVGWETIIDNFANYTDGLTQEEFIRHKNFTVPVPQGEFFEIDFSFKKSASYSDLETGRFIVRIRAQYSSEWRTIADLYSTTVAAYEVAHPLQCLFPTSGAPHAQRNIHHSVRAAGTADDDMLQRIFFGQYSKRENTDFEIMFAEPRFYSGIRDL